MQLKDKKAALVKIVRKKLTVSSEKTMGHAHSVQSVFKDSGVFTVFHLFCIFKACQFLINPIFIFISLIVDTSNAIVLVSNLVRLFSNHFSMQYLL